MISQRLLPRLVGFAALAVVLGAGCAWQRIPTPPPVESYEPIPITVGVELSPHSGSQVYGPRVVDQLSQMSVFENLIYPYRSDDPVDAILAISIDGSWQANSGASFASGFAIGLTLGLLSPVVGPSMSGSHDLDATLRSGAGDRILAHTSRVESNASWGLMANTNEVAAKADDLQSSKIALEIAQHLRFRRQEIVAALPDAELQQRR